MRSFLMVTLLLMLLAPVLVAAADEGFLTTEPGVEIYWKTMGEGAALIVPGGFLYGDDLDYLARDHRLILYDMRNRGRSSSVDDPERLTIEGDLRDLESLRVHFAIEKFSTIGYSYLGKMVVLYALEHPGRVERILQLGPVPMRFDAGIPVMWDSRAETALDPVSLTRLRALRADGLHETDPRRYCEEEWLVTRVGLTGDPDLAARLESRCELPNEWPTNLATQMRHHFPSVQRRNVSPLDLAGLDRPVLTIHGTRDRNAPYGGGWEWAAMLPNARLRTVSDGAHQSWLDEPAVLDEIAVFLSGRWPDSAVPVDIATAPWLAQLRGVELLERIARSRTPDDAERREEMLSLRLEGSLHPRSQSRSSRPPYDRFPFETDLLLESGGSRIAMDETIHWPHFITKHRTVVTPDTAFELDLQRRVVAETVASPADVRVRQLMLSPADLASSALADPGAIRHLGVDRSNAESYQMIGVRAGQSSLTLWIDRDERIRQIGRLVDTGMTGDGWELTLLEGEQTFNGRILPRHVTRLLDEEVIAAFEIAPGLEVDQTRFAIPSDFVSVGEDDSGIGLDEIASGIWLVSNIGGSDYKSLVVVQGDELVLLETPVVTHHHFDHAGGIRAVMRAGARIIVPRGSEELFRHVALAPRSLGTDFGATSLWTARIDSVEREVIEPSGDGAEIHLYTISDSVHADGMIFAWIPRDRILFQGDLFVKYGESIEKARPQAEQLLRAIDGLGLDVERIVGVHGVIATMEDLRGSVRLASRNRQPFQ